MSYRGRVLREARGHREDEDRGKWPTRGTAISWLILGILSMAGPGCKRRGPPPPPLAPAPQQAPTRIARAADETTRLVVIGDFGYDGPGLAATARLIRNLEPDAIITTGDNNYPEGTAETLDRNVGQYFHDYIGDYQGVFGAGSAVNRFFPAMGNHDWLSGGDAHLEYFSLPGNERYYRARFGPVTVHVLDTDRAEPDGTTADSRQADWLRRGLATSTACHDLVVGHHPPYSSGFHGSTETMRWPFAAWGAEAVLSGHDHIYERYEVDGLPYVVDGLGGRSLYAFGSAASPSSRVRFNEDYGVLLLRAKREEISYEFLTVGGKKVDSFTRPGHCPPAAPSTGG